ncbi:hypothetical protein CesoFtcFv8_027847 [Champsocephalus esox]|uniref:Uncharacterized protein n=1 Tax=Champsocephalus esox TaxID=159716 RepID=A0AAN8GB28_9TELE|nr:hypothetical protein CesoFtcFv8_027847 [Champsocephalus esox]
MGLLFERSGIVSNHHKGLGLIKTTDDSLLFGDENLQRTTTCGPPLSHGNSWKAPSHKTGASSITPPH